MQSFLTRTSIKTLKKTSFMHTSVIAAYLYTIMPFMRWNLQNLPVVAGYISGCIGGCIGGCIFIDGYIVNCILL